MKSRLTDKSKQKLASFLTPLLFSSLSQRQNMPKSLRDNKFSKQLNRTQQSMQHYFSGSNPATAIALPKKQPAKQQDTIQ